MNRLFLYSILIINLGFLSCSRTIYEFETIPKEPIIHSSTGSNSASDIEIRVNYESSELDLSVFQVDIYNGSEDTLFITNNDIIFSLYTDYYIEGAELYPLDKDFLINDYKHQHKQVQQEKKESTFWNIFISGLDIASFAISTGGISAGVVGLAAESTAYILEDRSYYNSLSGSLEEQINYVEDWVLDEIKIAPGQRGAFDLLFEHVISDGKGRLDINIDSIQFEFPYILQTRKVKK